MNRRKNPVKPEFFFPSLFWGVVAQGHGMGNVKKVSCCGFKSMSGRYFGLLQSN